MKKSFFTLFFAAAAILFTSPGIESLAHATGLPAGQSCGQNVAPLMILSGGPTAGTITTTNTSTDLNISIMMDPLEGYKILDLFIYAGPGPLPTHPVEGWLDYQQFNVKQSFYPSGTDGIDNTLSLSGLVAGNPVGQEIKLAVYAVLVNDAGEIARAWAYGDQDSGCGCYGVTYPYTICGQPEVTNGCTYSKTYWRKNNELAKKKKNRIDWPLPMDERQKICTGESRNNVELLRAGAKKRDAYVKLAREIITAKLNIAKGASSTPQVDAALVLGQSLISAHCGKTVHPSTADGKEMLIFKGVLKAYNNGLTGPGQCNSDDDECEYSRGQGHGRGSNRGNSNDDYSDHYNDN